MLAMRCAGLQIYNSWMVPQYLAFLQAGGFAVQEHALLGDTLAPLCYARAVPDKRAWHSAEAIHPRTERYN